MITDEQAWNIIEDYFIQNGPVYNQVDSFNNFINHGFARIINDEPDIYIKSDPADKTKAYSGYRCSFSDLYIPSPTVTEENRVTRKYYPSEARIRDLTYGSPIMTTVTQTIEYPDKPPEVKVTNRVQIGHIPIMLRSSKCYLSKMTHEERIKAGECSHDSGGYFVIKGKERVLVAQIRNNYNTVIVQEKKPTLNEKYKFTAEIRSMSEETGHSVLIEAMLGLDNKTILCSIPYISTTIPVGVVFKAMGFFDIKHFIKLSYQQTAKYINYIINDSAFVDEKSDGFPLFKEEELKKIAEQEESNVDNKKSGKSTKSSKSSVISEDIDEHNTIIEKKWEKLSEKEKCKYKNRMTQNNALLHIGRFTKHTLKDNERLDYAKQVVDSELFPHMGIASTPLERGFFFGRIIRKLIKTVVGLRKEDDLDHYKNKRVEMAGLLCYDLAWQLFKKFKDVISSSIEKKKHTPDMLDIITKQTIITKGFTTNFSTGNWGVPKNSYIRTGVSQILSRLSFGATISNLRKMNIPIGKDAKIIKIRQINPSQIMYVCPSDTPEGQPAGVVLHFSLLALTSKYYPTHLVKEIIESCENLVSVGESDDEDATEVFLNGILVGLSEDPEELVNELKSIRNCGRFAHDVSISYDDVDNEINVYCDEGRMIRPVFSVEKNKLKIRAKDGTNWRQLVSKGLIQYVDHSEIDRAVVAFHPSELGKYHIDYCEIAAAMMLSVLTSIIPFSDHSQSPRNCYSTSHSKQNIGMPVLSYKIRADTLLHILHYGQRSLVSTKTANFLGFKEMPGGVNAIVAIACYYGYNQEDGIAVNYSAIERGMFVHTAYHTYSDEEKKNGNRHERIGIAPLDSQKHDGNYGFLDPETGVVRTRFPNGKSVYVQKGDVIIAKMLIQTDKSGKQEITDCSTILKKGEEGYVDRVYDTISPNGYRNIKVVIRKVRIPELGDKFSSRVGQKGTIGGVFRQEDMPYTASGLVPDIIMNPHAFPSRMTIAQILESVLGKSCVIEGEFGDATAFTESSTGNIAERLCERLEMNGFSGTGKEMMYNGMTGEPMGMVFIGPVCYQRLKHLVDEKYHARNTGPVNTLTKQASEGRQREGGLKFGEMERDVMIAHGSARFLKERLFEQSDPFTVPICQECGNLSDFKKECKICKTDNVAETNIPYASKLVFQEIQAMCIKTTFKTT
jgi:DNA-directed RNA polymerase II subunit RPB2